MPLESPPFNLALVTGASSGIGEELAKLLANKGINLILSGRNQERLNILAQELSSKVQVEIILADLSQPSERELLVNSIQTKIPDLVINNAGFGFYGDALSCSMDESLTLIEVDVNAVVEFTLEAARALISAGKPGVILNVSSVAAFFIFPGFSIYSASKAFINQFTESFDEEVRLFGVRALAACPGVVSTSFRQRAGGVAPIKREFPKPMTPAFAAQEIWRQIEKRKKIHIFNWIYRFFASLVNVLPKSLVANILRKSINKRGVKQEIIKKNNAKF
jgi:short-subunit dehydrogenase